MKELFKQSHPLRGLDLFYIGVHRDGILQPIFMVVMTFFQVGKRDGFTFSRAMKGPLIRDLGLTSQIDRRTMFIFVELFKPHVVDFVPDLVDHAVVIQHLTEDVLVGEQTSLADDILCFWVFQGLSKDRETGNIGEHLKLEAIGSLVLVEVVQHRPFLVLTIEPDVHGFLKKANVFASLEVFLEQFKERGFTRANIAFDREDTNVRHVVSSLALF